MESGYFLPSWLDCVGGAPIKQTAWNERRGEEKKKRLHCTELTHFLTMTLISAEKKGGGESGKNIPEVLWFMVPLSSLFQKPRAE